MTDPKKTPEPKPRPARSEAGAPTVPGVPQSVRIGGSIACVQALVGFLYAAILLFRQVTGARDASIVADPDSNVGWVAAGTAVFFLIVFGTVFAGGLGLARGRRRWGRGAVIILQIILLPISFSMLGAGAWLLGAVTLATAVATLVALFNPTAVRWAANSFDRR